LDQEMSVHERLAWSKNRAHLHFFDEIVGRQNCYR
jgi:hypothetical protein